MAVGTCIEEFLRAVNNGRFDEAESVAREYGEKQGYKVCKNLAETVEKAKENEELRKALLELADLWDAAKNVARFRGNLVGSGLLPQEFAKLAISYYMVLNDIYKKRISDEGLLAVKTYVEAMLDNIIGVWDISTRMSLIAALTANAIAVSGWEKFEELRSKFTGLIGELVEAKFEEIKSRLASIEEIRKEFNELKKHLEEVEKIVAALKSAQSSASDVTPALGSTVAGIAVRLAEKSSRQLDTLERALGMLRGHLLALDESRYNTILDKLGRIAVRLETLESLLNQLGVRSRGKQIPGKFASWSILGFAVDYLFEIKKSILGGVEHRLRILSAYQGTAEATWLYHESLSPGTPSITIVHLLVPKRGEGTDAKSLSDLLDLIRSSSRAYVVMREYIEHDEQQIEIVDAVVPEEMNEAISIVYNVVKHIVSRGAAAAALVAAVGERGEYEEERCISLGMLEKLVKRAGDDAKMVLDELWRESVRYGVEFEETGSKLCVRLAPL